MTRLPHSTTQGTMMFDAYEVFLKDFQTIVPGATVRVDGHIDRPPMEPTRASLGIIDQIKAQGQFLGVNITSISTGGCSDGNFTAALGTPTVDGMGIVGANSHGNDEYAELSSITTMVNLVARVCSAITQKK